jgi:hypothetical protein
MTGRGVGSGDSNEGPIHCGQYRDCVDRELSDLDPLVLRLVCISCAGTKSHWVLCSSNAVHHGDCCGVAAFSQLPKLWVRQCAGLQDARTYHCTWVQALLNKALRQRPKDLSCDLG